MNSGSPQRRVRMIAATYLKGGVIAKVDEALNLPSSQAAEFVANGRAVYEEPRHNDVQVPNGSVTQAAAAAAAAALKPEKKYA
jgi:hypothetical protein